MAIGQVYDRNMDMDVIILKKFGKGRRDQFLINWN